jgi:hypothetical protein
MYHLHLTVMTHLYEKEIIYGLVEKGYKVVHADKTYHKEVSHSIGELISLLVEASFVMEPKVLFKDVFEIVNKIKAKYYSIIIYPFSPHSLWAKGNFSMPIIENKTILN